MKVVTSVDIAASAETVWPLLTGSHMTASGKFCLGVPKPVSCEIPTGEGKVGAERRCISNKGTVIQRILEWTPPSKLRFQMETTDHKWEPCVEMLDEQFFLTTSESGTKLTRQTTYRAKGWFRFIKELMLWVGLKRVHLYVFKNWKQQSEEPS